jgi:deoxyribose-phosphate aldolase
MKNTDFLNPPRIDLVGIEERVARITARSIKKESKMQGLLMALNMIDLTTLEGADTDEKVKQLCFKAHHLHDEIYGLPTTAAVCVYPNFVKLAVNQLKGTGVKVASVATAFPSGQTSAKIKLLDTKNNTIFYTPISISESNLETSVIPLTCFNSLIRFSKCTVSFT